MDNDTSHFLRLDSGFGPWNPEPCSLSSSLGTILEFRQYVHPTYPVRRLLLYSESSNYERKPSKFTHY